MIILVLFHKCRNGVPWYYIVLVSNRCVLYGEQNFRLRYMYPDRGRATFLHKFPQVKLSGRVFIHHYRPLTCHIFY
jgi:hypothetical protein